MATVAVIGAGPAGLIAAETLAQQGVQVALYDAMPSFGRKFLMAGKSGLNITHAEAEIRFLSRYLDCDPRLEAALKRFGPNDIRAWMQSLGIDDFVGTTGRVFPTMMKASPLLRAWLARLAALGVVFFRRHRWRGWDAADQLIFDTADGVVQAAPDAVVLALGGCSWRRLGSDGAWRDILSAHGVETVEFEPRNCGFSVAWSDHLRSKWAGIPLKSAAFCVDRDWIRGECVLTEYGLEGGAMYTLAATLNRALARQAPAELRVDLLPDLSLEALTQRLARPRGKASFSNFIRKATGLTGVKRALIYECLGADQLRAEPATLAARLKAMPISIQAPRPIDEAISTAGGVSWSALDPQFGLHARRGVFCAGEMIAWDAPTGGYLLSACFATGVAAAEGALAYLGRFDKGV